ncbi:hypothetical protein, partial [Agrobacterium tumefaciens]|uniref:hypothetical protein n=1 Tax=Agrobacterium tumefaciens TaxID=358 RepID=UPI001AEEE2AF
VCKKPVERCFNVASTRWGQFLVSRCRRDEYAIPGGFLDESRQFQNTSILKFLVSLASLIGAFDCNQDIGVEHNIGLSTIPMV